MNDQPKPQPPDVTQTALEKAASSLQRIDPSPFSPQAFTRLNEKVEEFTAQLVTEAVKTSKRHQSDTVSISDVEHASQYLVSSTSHKIYKHIGTVGGILLGAGFSNILAIVTTGQFNKTGVILSFVLTTVGAFMVAIHVAKE